MASYFTPRLYDPDRTASMDCRWLRCQRRPDHKPSSVEMDGPAMLVVRFALELCLSSDPYEGKVRFGMGSEHDINFGQPDKLLRLHAHFNRYPASLLFHMRGKLDQRLTWFLPALTEQFPDCRIDSLKLASPHDQPSVGPGVPFQLT